DDGFPYQEKATTGADGKFQFTLRREDFAKARRPEPWKQVMIVAAAPGCGLVWQSPVDPDKTESGSLWLAEALPGKGRVVDWQGKPIAGVTVGISMLYYASGQDGRPLPFDAPEEQKLGGGNMPVARLLPDIVTDRDGRFELTGLGRDRMVD